MTAGKWDFEARARELAHMVKLEARKHHVEIDEADIIEPMKELAREHARVALNIVCDNDYDVECALALAELRE